MAIIMNKEMEKRSELTDRVNANLREREAQTSRDAKTDFTEGYGKDMKKSGKFSWVWFLLILLAAVSLIVIFVF